MRVRFQALLIGLVVFGAAAVAFALWPGSQRVEHRQHLPQSLVTKLTALAVREGAESRNHPTIARVVATTDTRLARLNHGVGPRTGTKIFLVLLYGGSPLVGHYAVGGPHASYDSPLRTAPGNNTVYEYRAKDLEQLDFGFNVSGRGVMRLGPSFLVRLR